MHNPMRHFLKALIPMLVFGSLSAPARPEPAPPAWGLGHPFTLEDLPFGDFRTRLESLPPAARNRAMDWLHSFLFTEQDLGFLRIDEAGGVYYADIFTGPENDTGTAGDQEAGSVQAASGVFGLQSRPGATNILYLDFDGHTISSATAWTSVDLQARPYDIDGDPATFSDAEQANIAEIWRRIAEDFAPFDVNITTQEPALFGPTVGRILVTADTDANGNAMPAQGAGGVAYVGVWGRSDYSSRYSPALVYYDNLGNGRADYVAEAASHEAGHNLSLSHDATSSSSYYGGHGSGYISWAPIMGTGYGRHVSQWSDGEYPDANNTQDDIAILDGHLTIRGDDHADGLAGATRLLSDAAGYITATTPQDDPDNLESANKGIIESAIDMDVFYFDTPGGALDLAVTPAWQGRYTRGGNLDIQATLYDAAGTLLLAADPLDDTDSRLSASLPAGRYYLAIQGVGNSLSPYPDYGSLGQYFISGTLPASDDGTAPVPDPMSWSIPPQAEGRDRISMTATTASDESGGVEYRFECLSGPAGCTSSAWQDNPAYTASGLQPGASYEFQVLARDAFLNTTAASVASQAMTDINLAPVAEGDSAMVEQDASVSVDVLANDSDPEGDPLLITGATQGLNGSVTHNGIRITYTPDPGYTGSDSFSYSIDDGFGGTAGASVAITISIANQPPLAAADSVSIGPGDTVVIDVLANDSDPDGDALFISAVTDANKGSVSWQPGDSTVTYTHNPKRKGSDGFSYTVSDARGASATTTVSISLGGGSDGGGTGSGGSGGGKGNGKGGKTR